MAVAGLQLYPGQRFRARVLRNILAGLLQARMPLPFALHALPVPRQDELAIFLAELTGVVCPRFAVLAGNPAAQGRRFIVMTWKADGQPVVVKVGMGPAARDLIEQEEKFLQQIPESIPGIPRVIKSLRTTRHSGFALPFLPGVSPAAVTPAVVQLLQGWLRPDQMVAARAVPTWTKLHAACGGDSDWARVAEIMEAKPFVATVAHGDFTPWNVRVSGGERGRALDWERGEFPGMPAWDWFHFVIQSTILVERKQGARVQLVCEKLLQREDFRAYAAAAGLAGRERECLLAYLYHVVQVLRPTEGLPENRELLAALVQAWLPR